MTQVALCSTVEERQLTQDALGSAVEERPFRACPEQALRVEGAALAGRYAWGFSPCGLYCATTRPCICRNRSAASRPI